jgi:hypothetical protein
MNTQSQSQSITGTTKNQDIELDHSQAEKVINVQFAEEQPIVRDDARVGTSLPTLPASIESQMPDNTWLASQQLAKPVVLSRLSWASSQTQGVQLAAFDFPDVIRTIDTLHQETLRMYAFFKFNWVLKFQINGTKFHSGQLVCSWDPFALHDDDPTNVYRPISRPAATGLPHVLLNASTNEPVEITIPFVHPKSFLATNTANFDTLGRFRINVLNQLRSAEGSSSSLHLTVWLFASSPSVHVPIYRHDLLPPSFELAQPSMEAIGNFVDSFLGDDFSKLRKTTTKTIGNLAAGNWGQAMRNGGKAVGHLADFLNLDYPVRVIMSLTHINPIGPMAVGRGVDSSYSLRLDPSGSQVIESDRKGNTVEECDVDFIKKVPMLIKTVPWTDARTSGTILSYWPVTPNICDFYSGDDLRVNYNTFLSYLSCIYQYWRGTLTYRLEFVSTQFHTGRLLVAFVPNAFAANPTIEQAFSCPNVVIDIQQNSTVSFTVPFTSQTPYKNCEYFTGLKNMNLSIVGYVYVFVLNELVRPSNVSDTIEFNIYISAEDDFQFAVPQPFTLNLRSSLPPSESAEPSIDIDRMQTRTGESHNVTQLSLAFGEPRISPSNLFGEDFPLLDLLKRYARLRRISVPQSVTNQAFSNYPTYLRDPDQPNTDFAATPVAYISMMFAAWYGSLRYKFVTNAPRNCSGQLSVMYDPSPNDQAYGITATDAFGGPSQRTNLDQNNALEVDVPCYTPFNLLVGKYLTVSNEVDLLPTCGRVKWDLEHSVANGINLDIYQAAGDDFRPFYLIAPPADYNTEYYHYQVSVL